MAEFDEVGRTIEELRFRRCDRGHRHRARPGHAGRSARHRRGHRPQPPRDRPSVRRDGEQPGFREPMRAPIKLVRDGTTGMADFDAKRRQCGHAAPRAAQGRRNRGRPNLLSWLRAGLRDRPGRPAGRPYLDIPAFLRRQAD